MSLKTEPLFQGFYSIYLYSVVKLDNQTWSKTSVVRCQRNLFFFSFFFLIFLKISFSFSWLVKILSTKLTKKSKYSGDCTRLAYSAVWLSATFFYTLIFLSLNSIRTNWEFTTNLRAEYLFSIYFFKEIIAIYLSFKHFILIII